MVYVEKINKPIIFPVPSTQRYINLFGYFSR